MCSISAGLTSDFERISAGSRAAVGFMGAMVARARRDGIGESADRLRQIALRLDGRAQRRALATALRRDPPRIQEQPGDETAEDEAADVGEERDAAAVRLRAEQPEVRLDELVQEPEPEEEPGGDLHGEDHDEAAHG